MGDLFFTSDLHLGHINAISLCDRPFSDVQEMNERLIENINNTVNENDTLYILGDVSFRNKADDTAEILRRIHCKNLYLVKGNHDKDLSKYGIFKEIADYKEIRVPQKHKLVLFHYPITDWSGMYRGSVHLHGHIHSRGKDYNINNLMSGRLQYDVGVDANDFRPVNIDEIFALMKHFNSDSVV